MRTMICPQNSPCLPVLLVFAQWNKSYSEVDMRVITWSPLVQPWRRGPYRGFSSDVLSANAVYISAAALAPSSRSHFFEEPVRASAFHPCGRHLELR